ncbi:2-aminoethylphosphonate--pyruvate transaminase [Zavarzinia sp. CC-PAN008]|uniref:2-aminoethylphosphonate--pyruvate transaminase n=1 Tax=Zavarzinia sp. CC-PAN008 TaxID=3243332 RepID=UPI003F748649
MKTLLLTPGPLTTSDATRAALNRDWGSRDGDFVAMSERVRARLAALAGVADTHEAVPVQGSGTFAVEAAIQTLLPRDGRLLVLVNGAYGRRMVEMAHRLGRAVTALEVAEDAAIDPAAVALVLAQDQAVTDVALVHCETTSGLLNPLEAIAGVVAAAGRGLMVDAMSSFGGVPIDGRAAPFKALMASANKGLEGVPGLGFVLVERQALRAARGTASSLSLDLHAQWQGFVANGQWRFTPPTQVVAALDAALDQLDAEGGVAGRHARYSANCRILVEGMARLGFETYVAPGLQAPVIVTFRPPAGDWFDFDEMYAWLHGRGIVIYPGKLTAEPSFRIGCIGAVGPDDMARAVAAIATFVAERRGVAAEPALARA